jgi:hypothetical protein
LNGNDREFSKNRWGGQSKGASPTVAGSGCVRDYRISGCALRTLGRATGEGEAQGALEATRPARNRRLAAARLKLCRRNFAAV